MILYLNYIYLYIKEDDGVSFRGLFIIDKNQILRQITVNDLPVGRDVDETLRLVQVDREIDSRLILDGYKMDRK